MSSLMQLDEEDIPFEEDVLRHPYNLKSWWRYLEFKLGANPRVRFLIYERALKELPGSYKLWFHYLKERTAQVYGREAVSPDACEAINNTFERCLMYLHKMPRIWLEYTSFLTKQKKLTRSRRTFDRALRALPLGQHERIWKPYIKFVLDTNVPEVVCRVYRRYLKISPTQVEDFIEYLVKSEQMDEASKLLVKIVNDDDFVSQKGKSKHELWKQLCEIISKHPTKIAKDIKVEAIIRGGLQKFTDEVGILWNALAEYYIRMSNFEKARNIFEEAVNTVMTVRDFSTIWDGYSTFEDQIVTAKMEQIEEEGGGNELELEMLITRYEQLLNRRPLLVSSVLLRQNPHNVAEWHKRIDIIEEKGILTDVVEEFVKAIKTVDATKATGKPHTLWTAFARFYIKHGNLEDARRIYEKAVQAPFKAVDDLASVWVDWAEAEIANGNVEKARELLQRATLPPAKLKKTFRNAGDPIGSVQTRLYKSTRLWSFYADLEENIGTFHSTKAVYEKIIDLKIATPQIIINYAHYLEEHKYFEESFKAYERGVSMFPYPFVFDIWVFYLSKFVKRYGGKKLERARDLYEQALEGAPAPIAKYLYVMYAELEEQYGLARHAMNIYDRATRAVPDQDKYGMYLLYVSRAAELFGVVRTREIYEKAISSTLPDKEIKELCVRYADMEKRLGEIDRARAIYIHASQFSDPRVDVRYWKTWEDFEVRYGNEDTFRELLRIKRSVQAQFNVQVNIMSAEMLNHSSKSDLDDQGMKRRAKPEDDEMAALERAALQAAQNKPQPTETFSKPPTRSVQFASAGPQPSYNEEEINLDDDQPSSSSSSQPQQQKQSQSDQDRKRKRSDKEEESESDEEEDEEDEQARVNIDQKVVPDSVFGGLKKDDSSDEETEKSSVGAAERLRRRKV